MDTEMHLFGMFGVDKFFESLIKKDVEWSADVDNGLRLATQSLSSLLISPNRETENLSI